MLQPTPPTYVYETAPEDSMRGDEKWEEFARASAAALDSVRLESEVGAAASVQSNHPRGL